MSLYRWDDARVRAALEPLLGGEPDAPNAGDRVYTGISTDSRSVAPGELFVALVGDRFDGHAFVGRAVAGGAAGVVVSRSPTGGALVGEGGVLEYRVADTLEALGALAAYRRSAAEAPVIAITGSSGKTTTKDFTAAALSAAFSTHATTGNRNNRVGVPLTLFAMPTDAEAAVLELGTNEPGEIAALAAMTAPDLAVVVTVGDAHIEKLGDLEGVLAEKLSLLRAQPAVAARPIVGDRPAILAERAREIRKDVRVAGTSHLADSDLRARNVRHTPNGGTLFTWRDLEVRLRIPGRHAVTDALIALTVAEAMDVEPAAAVRKLESVQPGAMRSELRSMGEIELVVDCYNASPQSLEAALDLLHQRSRIRAPRSSVAFLGTMLELGAKSPALHRAALKGALDRGIDLIVATGEFADAARALEANSGRVILADDWSDAYPALRERLQGDEVILLKASRGVALEGVIPLLATDFSGADAEEAGPADTEAGYNRGGGI